MAYKNTAGTSSITNEMGTWRYFNSGLTKLGSYKGANLSIPEKAVQPEEGNWAESLMHAFRGIGKATDEYLEAEKERKYKLVDEYLQQHSLEDYQKDIKAHAVPFQDDPIAMARLKYMHGKMSYSIIKQDFEREVIDQNKLKGLSPEQIDAEAFKYFQESKKDMLEAFGYNDQDEYFRRGFYESSTAGRVGFITKAQSVEDNEKTQESMLAEAANFSAIINDPNANYKSIIGAFDQIYDTVGVHYTPDQQKKLLDNLITMVANRADGVQLLEQLGNYVPPYAKKGETLRGVMGELAWGKAKAQARGVAWTRDAETWGADHRNIEDLVAAGNHQAIAGLAKEEAKLSGGALSDRYKWLIQSEHRAKVQADRLVAKANVAALKAGGRAQYEAFLYAGLKANQTGSPIMTEDSFRLGLKDEGITLTDLERKVVGQKVVQDVLTSGNQEDISTLLIMATSNGTPTSIREPVSEMLTEYAQDLDHRLNEIAMTGKIAPKDAVDILTDKKAEDFQYYIPGQARAISLSGISPGFQTLMSLYSTNPSAVRQILTNSVNGDTKLYTQLSTVDMAIRLGKNPLQVLADAKAFKSQQERKALESGAPKEQLLPRFKVDKNEIQGLVGTGGLNRATSDMLDTLTWAEVKAYKDANPTDETPIRKLAKAAMEKVANEFIGIRGFVLPIAAVQRGLGDVGVTPQDPETLAKYSNEVFQDYMKDRGLNTPMLYDSSFYEVNRDAISVVSLSGQENMVIPMKDFTAKIKEKIIKDIEKGGSDNSWMNRLRNTSKALGGTLSPILEDS